MVNVKACRPYSQNSIAYIIVPRKYSRRIAVQALAKPICSRLWHHERERLPYHDTNRPRSRMGGGYDRINLARLFRLTDASCNRPTGNAPTASTVLHRG